MYLSQNVIPQGKACMDIALNSQYLVLFDNPIDRQQVVTLSRRINPTTSVAFMWKFEDGTARPYGYLVLDLKSSTSEQDRLQMDIFDSVNQEAPDDGDMSDDKDADSVESISPSGKERDKSYKLDIWNRRVSYLSPPLKLSKLRDERSKPDIWNRRFQNLIGREYVKQFKDSECL